MAVLPAALYGAGAVASAIGSDQPEPGKLSVVNPFQRNLMQKMQYDALQGNYGDMGFGRAAKQGMGQLQQFMADRVVSPQSGVGLAAAGNVMANAASQDTGNLRNYMMGLTQMSPTIAQGNWDWTSPSMAPVLAPGQTQGGMYDPTKGRP